MCCNSIEGEQITSLIMNKAFIKKSKTIKFEICYMYAVPVLHSPALGFSNHQEIRVTDIQIKKRTDTQVHRLTTASLRHMHTEA